jgi:hypothetical protein
MTFRLSAGFAVSVALLFVTPTPGAAEPNKGSMSCKSAARKRLEKYFKRSGAMALSKTRLERLLRTTKTTTTHGSINGTRGNPKS